MTVDHDGKIRMDCSSPYAMARLVGLKDQYQVAFANDPDSDRHGIVTPSAGLMNPNHFLAVAIRYLLTHRAALAGPGRGRQNTGQQQHDRPRGAEPRSPVIARCRSVSSGSRRACSTVRAASAARRAPGRASCGWTAPYGRPTRTARSWTCLAAEITGPHGQGPGRALPRTHGGIRHAVLHAHRHCRRRPSRRRGCRSSSPEAIKESKLAGEPISAKLNRAPGNGALIGGLKVVGHKWLVRGSPIRHGERIQDLRRELQGREASAGDRDRSTADRERGSDSRRLAFRESLNQIPAFRQARAALKDHSGSLSVATACSTDPTRARIAFRIVAGSPSHAWTTRCRSTSADARAGQFEPPFCSAFAARQSRQLIQVQCSQLVVSNSIAGSIPVVLACEVMARAGFTTTASGKSGIPSALAFLAILGLGWILLDRDRPNRRGFPWLIGDLHP